MKTSFREVQSEVAMGEAALPGGATRLDGVGIVLGITGTVLFSMKAVLVKMAYEVIPDLPVVTLMMLLISLSFPVYVAILLITRRAGECRIGWRETGVAMLAGMLAYYVCTFLDFQGLKHITAQLE